MRFSIALLFVGLALLVAVAVLAALLVLVSPFVDHRPNPAAVYCVELGYRYEIVKTPLGDRGICIFPDGSGCDAWEFLNGRCGQNWSLCARLGGKIVPTSESCSISGNCAVCILPNGERKFEWNLFLSARSIIHI